MNLEDTLGIGRTLVGVIQRANGDIETYKRTLTEKLHKYNRGKLNHLHINELSTELSYAERLHTMEEGMSAKFTIKSDKIVLMPYVSNKAQRISVYVPKGFVGD